MKKIAKVIGVIFEKTPAVVIYILLIALLLALTYFLPKVAYVIGFIYQYGIYLFFGVVIIIIVLNAIFDDKE